MDTDGRGFLKLFCIPVAGNRHTVWYRTVLVKRPFYLCSSVSICGELNETLCYLGLLIGWTATVSETVSKTESRSTIHHYWLKLVDTLSVLTFKNTVGYRLLTRSDNHIMNTRFNLFRRAGVSFMVQE